MTVLSLCYICGLPAGVTSLYRAPRAESATGDALEGGPLERPAQVPPDCPSKACYKARELAHEQPADSRPPPPDCPRTEWRESRD